MTPEEHNRYLGITHLVYGGFYLLLGIGISLFILIVFGPVQGGGVAPPVWFLGIFPMFFLFLFTVL